MTRGVDAISRANRLIEHLVLLSGLRRRDDLLSALTQALAETTRSPFSAWCTTEAFASGCH
jgi:hypothetical protein